jgi:galactitol-specific phosphotransferase system IIC component
MNWNKLKSKFGVWSLYHREYLVGFIIGFIVGALIL